MLKNKEKKEKKTKKEHEEKNNKFYSESYSIISEFYPKA